MTKVKELYEAPATTVVEVKNEGIICASEFTSATINDYVDGTFTW